MRYSVKIALLVVFFCCAISVPVFALSDGDMYILQYTLAKDVNSVTYEPIDPINLFFYNQERVYLTVETLLAPKDTVLEVEWYRVQDADWTLQAKQRLDIEGDQNMYFSLKRPDNGWKSGGYVAVLFFNGKIYDFVPFWIKTAQHEYIKSFATVTSVDDDTFDPIILTHTFYSTEKEIHVRLAYDNAPPSCEFKVIWYFYEDEQYQQKSKTVSRSVESSDVIDFWVNAPEDGFWEGYYKVELYVDNEIFTQILFRVVDSFAD